MISILTAALLAAAYSGASDHITSTYTRIFEADCTELEVPGGLDISCPGYAGWRLNLAVGEHGQAIQYIHPSRGQSDFLRTPSRGLWGGYNNVIEWRLDGEQAFATIHRYRYDTPSDVARDTVYAERAEVLVVTALNAQTTCVIAYLDALSLENSNVWARRIADTYAASWDCGAGEPMDLNASSVADLARIAADHQARATY